MGVVVIILIIRLSVGALLMNFLGESLSSIWKSKWDFNIFKFGVCVCGFFF